MLPILKDYWTAVSTVFSDAWALPPRRSRLTHGIGIISLGFIMDAIADVRLDEHGEIDVEDFIAELSTLEEVCQWTSGVWEFQDGTQRKWNDVQNTPRDIQMVTNYLLGEYRAGPNGRGPRQLRLA
jgi:hypothetical protein